MVTIKKVRLKSNPNISIMGIVFTMLDKRLISSVEIKNEIKKSFNKNMIFHAEIPRNVRISEAQSHGEPIVYFDKLSKGADAYMRLSKEILIKCRERVKEKV